MVALFVALMFIGFLLVDLIVQRVRIQQSAVAAGLPWKIPEGLYLSEEHTWFRPDSSMGVRVGVDALLAQALGVVEKVVLPRLGDQVKAGQPLFHLENRGCDLRIPCSITGKVVALNPRLEKRPELAAKDPYGSGWICAITPAQSNGGPGPMRSGEKAAFWLEREFHRFQEFLSTQVSPDLAVGLTSQDGGLLEVGALTQLGQGVWSAFEAEFLRSQAAELAS
jgi:glycine cleavage system H protein